MSDNTQQIMMKTAQYIEQSQDEIEKVRKSLVASQTKLAESNQKISKYDAQRSAFIKRATQAAGVLANRGVIEPYKVNELVDKVAESPNAVWDIVEKLASSIPADSFAEAVNEKIGAGRYVDPFERNFFGIGTGEDGMIE